MGKLCWCVKVNNIITRVMEPILQTLAWVLKLLGIWDLQNYLDTRNNQTLHFHPIYGTKIAMDSNETTAHRCDKHCFQDGIVFSHRAIEPDETISVLVLETTPLFVGPLAIGFTCYNPIDLSMEDLKRIKACSIRPLGGFWIKTLLMHKMRPGMKISFRYTPTGALIYTVDGVEQEDYIIGVDVNHPLWAVFDVYGSVQRIKLIRPEKVEDMNSNFSNFENIIVTSSQLESERRHRQNGPGLRPNRRMQQALAQSSTRFRLSPQHESANPVSNYSTTMHSSSIRHGGARVDGVTFMLQEERRGMPLHMRRGHTVPDLNLGSSAWVNRQMSHQSPVFFTHLGTPVGKQFDSVNCVICLRKEPTMTVLRCGHLCLCTVCAQMFQLKSPRTATLNGRSSYQCPVCRDPISEIANLSYE